MTQRELITIYHPSVSGGTEQNRFLVSSGYFQQDGMVKYSGLWKYMVRLNDMLALTKRVKDSMSVNFNRSNSKATLELLRGAALANPIFRRARCQSRCFTQGTVNPMPLLPIPLVESQTYKVPQNPGY